MTDRSALIEALARLGEQQEIERRRYQEGFDGLLGRMPDGVSPLLATIIREIQHYLLRKYSDAGARSLLQSARHGMQAHEDMLRIPEGDLLALSILSKIHQALDAEGDRYLDVLLGKAGAHEYKRREASRKERHPEINDWIRKQLATDAFAKASDLYRRAPASVKDLVGKERFRRRVNAQRKQFKADASQ